MTVREIILLFASATAFLTALGGGIGYVIGAYFPAYYRTIFVPALSERPDFDPLAMGVGQGLTQGITAGAVVGVILVVTLTWYRAKSLAAK